MANASECVQIRVRLEYLAQSARATTCGWRGPHTVATRFCLDQRRLVSGFEASGDSRSAGPAHIPPAIPAAAGMEIDLVKQAGAAPA
jgi:hypothetical protein